jgi:hypothetical protein
LNEKIFKYFFRTKERKISRAEDKISNKEFKILLSEVFSEIFSKKKYKFEIYYSIIEDNNLGYLLLNKINQQENKISNQKLSSVNISFHDNKNNFNNTLTEKINGNY